MRMNQIKRTSARKIGFASRLREAMHDAGHIAKRAAKGGVDAKALKEAIGLHTVESARRYIEGLATPSEDKIDHIAAWLKINVQWLRDGEGPKHGGAVSSLSPVEHELLDDLRHCTDSDKQTLRALAKALRAKIG